VVERVSGDGALVVAAAGDPGSGYPLYPAAYPQSISVSAGDADGARSNPGDISAPGDSVLSPLPGGGHGAFSGTSAATPQVSGAAALLVGGGLSTTEARERLLSAARDVEGTLTPGLDAAAAVSAGEDGGCPGDDGGTRVGR
jgi:thermitase